MIVIVVDPIVCGQKPVEPRFHIEGGKLILQYDLTEIPARAKKENCTAHSIFELSNIPDKDLQVSFSGGPEPFAVATMTRCPNSSPSTDIWDCLLPSKY